MLSGALAWGSTAINKILVSEKGRYGAIVDFLMSPDIQKWHNDFCFVVSRNCLARLLALFVGRSLRRNADTILTVG